MGDPGSLAELDAVPELPALAAHVWGYFVDLRRTASGGGGMGPTYITRQDIRLWEQDEAVRLAPWERRAILDLDAAMRAAHASDKRGGG